MKKVLITGGLGHIGSFLTKHLYLNNHLITVVDNLATQRYCSLFERPKHVDFLNADFGELSEKFLSEFDFVIHLAAITDAAASLLDEAVKTKVETINTAMTKEFIQKCQNAGIKTFIFPSSTSVYGKGSSFKSEDDLSNVLPQSPYAESKLEVEEFLNNRKSSAPMDHIILRLGTIFGTSPGMRFHTAINKFCWLAFTNKPLTIWEETYHQMRPYLGLMDALQAFKMCLLLTDEMKNQTFNVISENREAYLIVQEIQRLMKPSEVKLDFVKCPLLNQESYSVDIQKLLRLGYRPSCKVEDGLRETLELLL